MFVVFPQLDVMENINFLLKHTALFLSPFLVYWAVTLEERRVVITSSLLTQLLIHKPASFETGLEEKEEEETF